MTLASRVVNKLREIGYEHIKPWTSKRTFGYDRIYYFGSSYMELSGRFGFQVVGYIPEELIEDCKRMLAEVNKEIEKNWEKAFPDEPAEEKVPF